LIVIDSSVLVAIITDEPERTEFIDLIVDHGGPSISASTYLETAMVLELRFGARVARELDVLIGDVGISVVPFDHAQAKIARDAFRKYGKGLHKAGLNFGDCFSYALAKALDAPLLFKGNDFSLTDIARAA
jgi:ribonuclease VapC